MLLADIFLSYMSWFKDPEHLKHFIIIILGLEFGIFNMFFVDGPLEGPRTQARLKIIITCTTRLHRRWCSEFSCCHLDTWNQVETPFAYTQLSPPTREFRKAELWSQNSLWPRLKHLTPYRSPVFCHFFFFPRPEAPVSPASYEYTQGFTLHCKM